MDPVAAALCASTGESSTQNNKMGTNRGYLFRACSSKGFRELSVAGTQSQAGRWKNFVVNLMSALIGGCWHGEAGDGLMRSGIS